MHDTKPKIAWVGDVRQLISDSQYVHKSKSQATNDIIGILQLFVMNFLFYIDEVVTCVGLYNSGTCQTKASDCICRC